MDYNELQHHGILGQKWGVRRFQNRDGSLTPAGKKRYSEKEQRYSTNHKEWAKQMYGTKRWTNELENNKRWSKNLEKMGPKGLQKNDPEMSDKEAKELYDEEMARYKYKIDDAKEMLKRSGLFDKRIDEIDVSSTSYRQVKKKVRKLINDNLNNNLE